MCLEVLVAFNISKEMKIDGLLTALEKIYEKPLALNKVFLMRRLFMNMLEGGFVVDHLNEFNMITSQLIFVLVNLMMKLVLCYFYAHFQKFGMA